MGIWANAISKLIDPAIGPDSALDVRIKAIEDRPSITPADRVTIDKAASLISELEAVAAAPAPTDEPVTVPGIV